MRGAFPEKLLRAVGQAFLFLGSLGLGMNNRDPNQNPFPQECGLSKQAFKQRRRVRANVLLSFGARVRPTLKY